MAKNRIIYEGRLINNNGQSGLKKAKTGKLVLQLVVAEQFQEKNKQAADKYKDPEKGAEEYVNTTTAWHRINVYSSADNADFLKLVKNPIINHGAVIEIEASYREEDAWVMKDGTTMAGRRESIFYDTEDGGYIGIKVLNDGRELGARDEWAKPLWDGVADLPPLGGSGGGGPAAPEYGENDGF